MYDVVQKNAHRCVFLLNLLYNKAMELTRYEKAKAFVYERFAKIHNEPLRIAAISHTAMVDSCVTLLAITRSISVEKAKIAALFHDYAQYIDNCAHSEHARLSSLHAHQYLSQSKEFKVYEIDDICFAIAQHSKKELFDSPLCELLKDADILARFLENPDKPPTGIKRQRLIDALADIQT